MTPTVSVLIPANDEAAYIGACLRALLASDPVPGHSLEALVIANGCRDDTADIARALIPQAAAQGWHLEVIARAEGCKIGALNAGDAAARGAIRVYLDADTLLSPPLLAALVTALDQDAPRYATGTPRIVPPQSWVTAQYARFWQRVPFMQSGAPGFGLFAVNSAGRARWGQFPKIISDDTFARVNFTPAERVQVGATYAWPMVEGVRRLVRVRRRQDHGVAEIAARYPHLIGNEGKPPMALPALMRRDPIGFAVYASVALLVRLGARGTPQAWTRGR